MDARLGARSRLGRPSDRRLGDEETVVEDKTAVLGSAAWVQHTHGWLTSAERRSLIAPLARTHLSNAVGRFRMALRVHPGRHAYILQSRLQVPETVLTRAARKAAEDVLTPSLLHHSYRAYRFGRALGELDGLQVDAELLFAAAMLHDIGLVNPPNGSDFTLSSMRLAREVADEVGLSTDATEVVQTAITMHYTPGVSTAAGPGAYLLSAGAAVDVAGVRTWDLPTQTLSDAVRDYPRLGFKRAFAEAFRAEAARVPRGRAQLLNRYGALMAAIKLAPFDE